ncbi:hypothetical protein SAMN04488508_104107 [Aquimarina spongiae]|uniref:Uncharacterized protein n=1 Tax=Aquimarina spongiae TaxID=570521 RepID=A0A1M6F5Y1_9FLAO|nr:hypothetical protein SAMN04488508_104107 [Aquimarina spongiae]
MLKNILHLENVEKIDRDQQKHITGQGFALHLPIGIACRKGDQICCGSGRGKCGLAGGIYNGGQCFCFNS